MTSVMQGQRGLQCLALVHLDLYVNDIGPAGKSSIVGVLPQCTALVFLDLGDNECSAYGGVVRFVRVLTQ